MTKIITLVVLTTSLFASNLLLQIDKNLQPGSSETYKKLINIEPDGSSFLKPVSEKGRNTLRLGENMWLYMPSVGRPIRITSMQSVVGGVFNNADIMRVDFNSEYNLVKEESKKDRFLLELKAKNDTIAYDKLLMIVDKKTITPIQIECYSSTGMLIKTLYYKDIKDFGSGIVRPSVIETKSPFYKGYKSIMIYGKITPKKFPPETFTIDNINKVDDLRR